MDRAASGTDYVTRHARILVAKWPATPEQLETLTGRLAAWKSMSDLSVHIELEDAVRIRLAPEFCIFEDRIIQAVVSVPSGSTCGVGHGRVRRLTSERVELQHLRNGLR